LGETAQDDPEPTVEGSARPAEARSEPHEPQTIDRYV